MLKGKKYYRKIAVCLQINLSRTLKIIYRILICYLIEFSQNMMDALQDNIVLFLSEKKRV